MSKLIKAKIKLPSNLEIRLLGGNALIKSNLGQKIFPLPSSIQHFKICKNTKRLSYGVMDKEKASQNASDFILFKNIVKGFSLGYKTQLVLAGVGFQVSKLSPTKLTFRLGYSHLKNVTIPKDLTVLLPKKNTINIFGIDKNQVSSFAATLCSLKKVEPYKGKGILLKNQQVKLKKGKKL